MQDAEMLGAWARALKSRDYSPDTLYNYARVTRVFVAYLHERDLTLATCRACDVQLWLDTCKIGPKSRYVYISTLAALYAWLIREELLEHDPTVRVDRPRLGTYLPRPANPDQVATALAELPPRTVAMIALGAFAGLRVSEITRLRVEDLLTHRRPAVLLVHGKGKKERLVPMHRFVMASLKRHGIPKTGYMFPNPEGRALSRKWVGHLVASGFDEIGGHVTPHMLRHLFASLLYEESKGDLRMVQDMLGHSNPSSTAIYTKLNTKRAAKAVQNLSLVPEPEETDAA